MVKSKVLRFILHNLVLILIGVVSAAVVWFLLQRESRGLSVILDTHVPVVSLSEEYADSIDVRFGSRHVKSVDVVECEVRNSGNVPILTSDFDIPITFCFAGSLAATPTVHGAHPPSLVPRFTMESPDCARLEPLLLNAEDSFRLRSLIFNARTTESIVTIRGRVVGIKTLELSQDTEDRAASPWEWLAGLASIIAGGVSVLALLYRSRALRSYSIGRARSLADAISADVGSRERVHQLGESLKIDRYDVKSNVALLRVKIESLLSEIGRAAGVHQPGSRTSIRRLSQELEHQSLISSGLAAAIRDVLPAMNRELHSSTSYLEDREYRALQELALSIVAALEDAQAQPGVNSPKRM